MKKFLLTALIAVMGLSAQAQIVSSRTAMYQKAQRTFMWTARAGYSIDMNSGASGVTGGSGFDTGFGFTHFVNKEHKRSGLFWGFEATAMTNSAKYDKVNSTPFIFGIYGTPRVGYKFLFPNKMAIAPYGGFYVGYMLEGKESKYDYQSYSVLVPTNTYGKYSSTSYKYYYQTTENKIKAGECVTYGLNFGVEFFFNDHFFVDMHYKFNLNKNGKTNDRSYGNITTEYNIEQEFTGSKFTIGVGVMF